MGRSTTFSFDGCAIFTNMSRCCNVITFLFHWGAFYKQPYFYTPFYFRKEVAKKIRGTFSLNYKSQNFFWHEIRPGGGAHALPSAKVLLIPLCAACGVFWKEVFPLPLDFGPTDCCSLLAAHYYREGIIFILLF